MLLLLHYSVGLDSCPEANNTNMFGCDEGVHVLNILNFSQLPSVTKQDQIWLREDSLKPYRPVNMMPSNYLTIKPNRHYCALSQILNVLCKQMTCIKTDHLCKLPCPTQSYCSSICTTESDVYGSSAVFVCCHMQSCHCTDSDGPWYWDAAGH